MKTTLKPFCGEERERRIGLEDFFNQKKRGESMVLNV